MGMQAAAGSAQEGRAHSRARFRIFRFRVQAGGGSPGARLGGLDADVLAELGVREGELDRLLDTILF